MVTRWKHHYPNGKPQFLKIAEFLPFAFFIFGAPFLVHRINLLRLCFLAGVLLLTTIPSSVLCRKYRRDGTLIDMKMVFPDPAPLPIRVLLVFGVLLIMVLFSGGVLSDLLHVSERAVSRYNLCGMVLAILGYVLLERYYVKQGRAGWRPDPSS